MKFGRIEVGDAEGAILVHTLRLDKTVFKKGRVLSVGDLAKIRAAGLGHVTAARLERDDVPEDEAASSVASAAGGAGVRTNAAFTGRCNLYAELAGLAVIDAARVDRLNLVDETVTIATVAPYEVVEPGQMLATVKVIPFAAPRAHVDACATIAAEGGPLVRVARLTEHPAGLVLTRLPGMKEGVLDKTAKVLRRRLEALGSRLAREIRCSHNEQSVADAVRELLEQGCAPVLVFGASAIVDRRDVVPAGIERAGGSIDHFGMPVDPGNLMLLAHHGGTPVLGMPGCARSPKLNGFDWVLRRLLADLPVTRADIMRMGPGGLLKEIELRGRRRDAEDAGGTAAEIAPRVPRIAALVLAAGQSRRMGSINKLLAEIEGTPMVVRVVEAALESQAAPVVVVLGHEADQVRAALAGRDVRFAENPEFAEGLSTSLRHGVGALPGGIDGALVLLGDMPAIRPHHLDRLIAAFDPTEGRSICVPTTNGKRGNPVLWGAAYFHQLQEVAGDVGARHLIGEHAEEVCEVAVGDEAIFTDIDTPDALTAIRGKRD